MKILFVATFALSFVAFLLYICERMDKWFDALFEHRKWLSWATLYAFLSEVTKTVFHLILIAALPAITGFAWLFFMTPGINRTEHLATSYMKSDTLKLCSSDNGATCYTIISKSADYEPTRKDPCVYCGKRYWRHHRKRTEEERRSYNEYIQNLMSNPQ